jgi:hypothetical protein
MKLLYSSRDSARLGLFFSRLQSAGIQCEMRNEHLAPAAPGAPFDPEIWVLSDDQFEEAQRLLADWLQPRSDGQAE